MPDERESPSAGWREVYHEMEATTDAEDTTHLCPDCGRTCENVLRDVYECEEHGVFRAFARDDESERSRAEERERRDADGNDAPDADDSDERRNRTRGSAGTV